MVFMKRLNLMTNGPTSMIGMRGRLYRLSEMGGMAIRNMGVVALTAYACSLVASLKRMATTFPEWIDKATYRKFRMKLLRK